MASGADQLGPRLAAGSRTHLAEAARLELRRPQRKGPTGGYVPRGRLGRLAATVLTGWLKDATGSFAAGCYLAAGVALAGGMLVLLVRGARAGAAAA